VADPLASNLLTMLRISIVRSAGGLEPLRGAWERLYQDGEYSIFQSPDWNLLAARAFADRAAPMVIRAEGDSGAAIIPACVTNEGISFLGEALFDYRDVLTAGEDRILRRAWEQVAAEQKPLSLTALRGERARRQWEGLGFSTTPFCAAPAVRRADGSADEFAARHTRSGRLLRRLERAGVEFRIHNGAEKELVRHVYQSKAQQLAGRPENLFADDARIDFLVAIAGRDSGCEIFTLETAGTLVAAMVTFRERQVRRFYTVYHDPGWAHHSPGTALLYEVTRRSLEQGLDCDYMTGEQPHKMRFATHSTPLFRVEAPTAELTRLSGLRLACAGKRAPVPIAA
jgi:CelD/BcsL family acetyltransferase involved in cellulose biosynthesis